MVTIHRQHGLRFVIHTDDHGPAHVHVLGTGEMKVTIRGIDGLPEMTSVVGLKADDRRRAMDVILERQAEFLALWREVHGGE